MISMRTITLAIFWSLTLPLLVFGVVVAATWN